MKSVTNAITMIECVSSLLLQPLRGSELNFSTRSLSMGLAAHSRSLRDPSSSLPPPAMLSRASLARLAREVI